ncbi:hypothetical protein C8R47DRAFT_737294 [Mycena vitilis]|nr:hypothetical protein C8R47DRAFT_737294 [Mycena vitilis]
MAPQLNPEQQGMALAMIARIRDVQALRAQEVEANPEGATRSDGLDDSSTGMTRRRDEDDDGYEDPLAPYSLEAGRAFKRHKNLSGQSDSDADLFLKTANPSKHMYQLLCVGLQCRDHLEKIVRDSEKKFKLPDTVAKTCHDYAYCALLSPGITHYRNPKDGPTIPSDIVGVMRAIGIAQLPPPHETGRCEVLRQCVNGHLIQKRYHIRAQIEATLSGPKVDIATLTRACIGTSNCRPTVPLYQRIALIRSLLWEYKNDLKKASSEDNAAATKSDKGDKDMFWVEVDKRLVIYHSMSATDRQMSYELTYEDDVKAYGQPDSLIPITAMKNVEEWLKKLNVAMEN